jgi:hypothetical protein
MARGNNKTINVKIPTEKVIKALESRLKVIKAEYEMQDELETKFQKAHDKWDKDLKAWALKNFSKAKNVRTNHRSWNSTMNVDFDLYIEGTDFPKEPNRDYQVISSSEYNDTVEEIENALRILRLTDEEVVSTSTYNSIARYL